MVKMKVQTDGDTYTGKDGWVGSKEAKGGRGASTCLLPSGIAVSDTEPLPRATVLMGLKGLPNPSSAKRHS